MWENYKVGKLESDPACPGKGSEKTWEDIRFTLKVDPWHSDNLNTQQQQTTDKNN